MTIHHDHPFVPAEHDRDAVRRLRGRLAAPVTIWAAGTGRERVALTVSSLVIAEGRPAQVLGLVDEDSQFAEAMPERFAVSVLADEHRYVAEAFAGQAPAPGGVFTLGDWSDSQWGPVLDDAAGWFGVERDACVPDGRQAQASPAQAHLGWALVVTGVIADIHFGDADALIHVRGRYRI